MSVGVCVFVNGPPAGNGIWRIDWSRDRRRHVIRCERAALRTLGGRCGLLTASCSLPLN